MIEKLKGHIPDNVYKELPEVISRYEINTPLRLAHFLSQCYHESNHFTATVENLNYSEEGLLKTFPRYFDKVTVKSYARNPQKIASRVYANRMGNRDESSGDGYKFRGRGYIQLTGKENYILFGESIGVDLLINPDLVATKYPLLSAAWYWKKKGLNELADKGSVDTIVYDITKRVNGGTNGLKERIQYFKKFHSVLI
jgi:putative chitinase